MKDLTRREFLRIATTTISAAVLASPALALLLPEASRQREEEPAYRIAIDSDGYIYDPNFNYKEGSLPTYRELLDEQIGISHLSNKKQRQALAEWFGIDDLRDLHVSLDEQADLEYIDPRTLAANSEYWVGIVMYEELDWGALDLRLVEGEYPGHTFTAVKANDPEGFQEVCLLNGVNVEVVSIGDDYW